MRTTGPDRDPTGAGWGERAFPTPPRANANANAGTHSAKTSSNGINYHGGPVLTSPSGTNAYYIWYGKWSGNSATTVQIKVIAPRP